MPKRRLYADALRLTCVERWKKNKFNSGLLAVKKREHTKHNLTCELMVKIHIYSTPKNVNESILNWGTKRKNGRTFTFTVIC